MENQPSVRKALKDLLEILHSGRNLLEYPFCFVNDTKSWHAAPGSAACFELSFYKGPNVRISTAGKSYLLSKGSFTLFDIYKGYRVDSSSTPYHYISFQFRDILPESEVCLRLKEICTILETGIPMADTFAVERAFFEINREYLMKNSLYKQRISLLIQDMLISLLRMYDSCMAGNRNSRSRQHASVVNKVLLFLGRHYAEPIKLENIAAHTGYTNRYVDTMFKQATGYTVIQYLTKIRIEASKKALLSGNLPITAIALDCGFESSSYFCTVFKKVEGLPPSKYRQNLKP